ncbi:MAG: hypothetical protein AAGB48_09875 [Planctomycetota bacterium]
MTDPFVRGGAEGDAALSFGPYELVRRLRPSPLAERFLVLHPERLTHHVGYRFALAEGEDRERFLKTIERSACLSAAHLLPVEQFSLASAGEAWVISPFTGDTDGLLLLQDHQADKGGLLDSAEVIRALGQLLEASQAGASCGLCHGPVALHEVQIDRRGSLQIELYGVARALGSAGAIGDDRRDEIRSIVAIGYELVTGVKPESAALDASRLVSDIDPKLSGFLRVGLDPDRGYSSAEQALGALTHGVPAEPEIEVRATTTRRGLSLPRRRSRL